MTDSSPIKVLHNGGSLTRFDKQQEELYPTEHIGYEVELNSFDGINEGVVAKELGINFDKFTKPSDGFIGKPIETKMKMSREYYSSTIEINFEKTAATKALHEEVKAVTNKLIDRYKLTVYGECPSFVGTHIHLFNSELYSLNKDQILKIVWEFIIENSKELHKNSVYRLVKSHQLLGNYSFNNPRIGEILAETIGGEFMYPQSNRNKPKYNPVIRSPRTTTGKGRSIEIRCIPTEYIINGKILELLDRLHEFDVPEESVEDLYYKLIKIYASKKDTRENSRSNRSII